MAHNIPAEMSVHPGRDSLYAELHSRPFQVIATGARVTHIAVLCDENQKRAQFEHLQRLCDQLDVDIPEKDSICIEFEAGPLRIRREKHMEFSSYTFIYRPAQLADNPFDQTAADQLPESWLGEMPGVVVAAFNVAVDDGSQQQDLMLPQVKQYFEGMRLIGSSPQNGDARVWTTFQLHSDGYGRFLVYNKKMSDSQLGRLVQRLMEIETYRLMALLSLATAREFGPVLAEMDAELAALTSCLASQDRPENEQDILGQLTDMAARVESCRAASTFRFGATRAYHALVSQRLTELREDEVSGHLTMNEFMTRRLTPAVRTCEAVSHRLEDLSRRIDRVSDMMRTRVELSIQAQNQELLASMDRRSRIQLMMQHTVEGLSVAAISYYAVGLVKYLLDAFYNAGFQFDKSLILGISVPMVIALVWLFTRRIHKHFLRLATDKANV